MKSQKKQQKLTLLFPLLVKNLVFGEKDVKIWDAF